MSEVEPSEDAGPLSSQDLDQNKDEDSHGHFRFHLIEDLSYEDVKKCYRGSCVSCSWLLQALDVRGGVYMYGANVLSLVHSSLGAAAAGASPSAGGGGAKELLMTLPCPSAQTVSKYNSQYHRLFPGVPEEEILMKVYSCALLRDILVQGRLYISRHHLCFYANLFGRDIKVALPVVSVRLVKKHKTAGLVPNGLAITTDTGQKYVFVSLLSRDSVYDVLRRICTHLQVNGKSLSLKQLMEEPTLSLEEFPVPPEEFPVPPEFPVPVQFSSELKWREAAVVSSSLPDLLGSSKASSSSSAAPRVSTSSRLSSSTSSSRPSPTDSAFPPEDSSAPKLLPRSELGAELGQMEVTLLKLFTLLIMVLIVSSSYLAFRICSLEQQLSFLSPPPHMAPPAAR